MLRTYLSLALRQMLWQKGFSAINLFGLTIGIGCSLLIALYVYDEVNYDTFHRDSQSIYRLSYQSLLQGKDNQTALTPAGLYAETVSITGIESATRLAAWKTFPIRYGDKRFTEKYLLLADSNFFDFFTFELVLGNKDEALKGEGKIVLSESAAHEYFGYQGPDDRSPLGKTLTLAQGYEAQVTGIVKDAPSNSHIHFTHILSLASWKELPASSWLNPRLYTYVKLAQDANVPALKEQLEEKLFNRLDEELQETRSVSWKEFMAGGNRVGVDWQPLTRIHLYSRLPDEIEATGSIQYIYLFITISIFIALLACINFINLTTARSAGRSREVGIRKAVGATSLNLVKQFLIESYLYIFLAMLLAYGLIAGSLPIFNIITGKRIAIDLLLSYEVIVSLLAFTLIVGLVAGSYPAFYLTRFNPVEVLKGSLRERLRRFGIRNGLVIFQFFISSSLILATLIVYSQLQYLQNLNIGFDKGHIINLLHTKNLKENGAAFKKELLTNENILHASYCNRLPPHLNWTASFRAEDSGHDLTMTVYEMDYDHLETMELSMVQGRFFSPFVESDTIAVIINETAMKAFGWQSIINRSLFSGYDTPNGKVRQVIGVIRDFNFRTAREPITPLAIILGGEPNWEMAIRVKEGKTDSVRQYLQKVWDTYAPEAPFEISMVEQNLAEAYHNERMTGEVFFAFTLLSIFIASMGLYGLATFMAEQRTREIGIRKVLGGGMGSILILLNKEFLTLVIIGNLLSFPLAAWYMTTWLGEFEFHASVTVSHFLLTLGITLMVAFLSTSYRAFKAAVADPVKALRTE